MKNQLSNCHTDFIDQLKPKKGSQDIEKMARKNLITEKLKIRGMVLIILQIYDFYVGKDQY